MHLTEDELTQWRVFGFCLLRWNFKRQNGCLGEEGGSKEDHLRALYTDVHSQSPSTRRTSSNSDRRNYPAKLSFETAMFTSITKPIQLSSAKKFKCFSYIHLFFPAVRSIYLPIRPTWVWP